MTASFDPGPRLSGTDAAVLLVMAAVTLAVWPVSSEASLWAATAFVHFALFCNVFRVALRRELIWSASFVALLVASLGTGRVPSGIAIPVAFFLGALVIAIETTQPSYCGLFWRRINPELPRWWSAQRR